MKNINKNQLLEKINKINSRTYTEKPILIFLEDYRVVDDIIKQQCDKKYISMNYPFNDDAASIEREGSLLLGACLLHEDKDDLQWCIQWQTIHKKPVIVLLNKGEVSLEELEEDKKNPYMVEYDIMCAPKRKRDFSDLDKSMQSFIETHFETYNYLDENELLLNVILAALEGYANASKQKKGRRKNDSESKDAGKSGKIDFNYLLGQSIRQWQIPKDNWHTSKAAQNVWDMIVEKKPDPKKKFKTDLRAEKLCYKEPFICKNELELVKIPRFKGTTKNFNNIDLLPINGSHVFNDIFIAEHTTPVSDIRDALMECYNDKGNQELIKKYGIRAIREEVRGILNMIHIAQILKIEDRRINICNSRIKRFLQSHHEKGYKTYDYLKKTPVDQVFKDMRDEYYENLAYDVSKNGNPVSDIYKEALAIAQNACANNQTWANAVDVTAHYTIEI